MTHIPRRRGFRKESPFFVERLLVAVGKDTRPAMVGRRGVRGNIGYAFLSRRKQL